MWLLRRIQKMVRWLVNLFRRPKVTLLGDKRILESSLTGERWLEMPVSLSIPLEEVHDFMRDFDQWEARRKGGKKLKVVRKDKDE